ncbi:MAG: glutathione S-transferase family protein [Hyphomonadaceae bacterium]|nr:glutathione S-transferase family protein [Hyphomonadaceae bacterium]
MPMKLYNNDLSPFTTRVRLQIRAKGLENDVQIVPRPDIDLYKAINPTGKVPCLDTGAGFNLPESETICEFIEDSFPEPSLRGHTALGKAKVRLFSRFADLYIMDGLGVLFGQVSANPRDPARVDEGFRKLDEGMRLIETYLSGHLYATEERFTLADCALVPTLFFCSVMPPGFGRTPFEGRAKVKAYYERIIADDMHCARAVQEMGVALQAFMKARAA